MSVANPAQSRIPEPSNPTAGAPVSDIDLNPQRWLILVGLILASIMEVLDTTIVNVALPQMAGNMGATNQEIAWVSTSYILSNVVILPMTAFLAGRFGRRQYLSFSIALFIVASFFCGTSRTLGEIVFWRILQGAGGAALLSTAQATIRQIFPLTQQGTVQAIFILGIIVAPTLGPTLGGWITDNYSWSWNFFINIPIGIFSLFLVGAFLNDSQKPNRNAKVDWPGIGLLTVGLGCLQYVLEEGNKDDWFQSDVILILTIISVIALVAMLIWETWPTNEHPVINFGILKNKSLAAALGLFVSLGVGLYGGIYLFPLFVQTILHFTPTQTGLVLLPGGIATAVGVIICGRTLNGPKPLLDPRYLIFFGMAMFTISMWYLGHMTTQSGEPDTRFALILRGIGLGFLFTPINLVAFAGLKPNEIQQASGLINLTRQLGGSFGIAILGTYVQNQIVYHRTMLGSHIYAGNPALIERQQGIQSMLLQHGYTSAQASAGWLGVLNQQVYRQAATMAYNDGFLLILILFLLATPFVFLLRRPSGPPGGGDTH